MDRPPRELQRFPQTLRSFVEFVVLVVAFAFINFLSGLRTWFHDTRTALRTSVSRGTENDQPLASREESSLTNTRVHPRTTNWQRMRQILESCTAFTALSSTVAFFYSLFAISDAFDTIGRPAWDIAFHQENSSPSASTNENFPELEGLALRMGESFEVSQMMLSANLRKSISSKSQSKNISQSHNHPSPQKRKVGELDSRPTLRSETSPNYRSDQGKLTINSSKKFRLSNEVLIKSSQKELSPVKFKTNLNECLPSETLKNDHPQEGSTRINARDISRRQNNEESGQERSVRQISSSRFYRINEGAGPSSQLDSVPWQEISKQDTTKTGKRKSEKSTQTSSGASISIQGSSLKSRISVDCKESKFLPNKSKKKKMPGSSRSYAADVDQKPIKLAKKSQPELSVRDSVTSDVYVQSSPEKVARKERFGPQESPPLLFRPLFSVPNIDPNPTEQSAGNFQHGNANLQESLASLPWDRIITTLSGVHQCDSYYRRKLIFSRALSQAQIPSLQNRHENIRNRGSPYQCPGTSHPSSLSQKSPERSRYVSAHSLGSTSTILSHNPPTANPISPVRPREETLNKQESATSLETSKDLNKQPPPCGSECEDTIGTGPSSTFFGTVIDQNVYKGYLDGSRGENTPLQGSSHNNSTSQDGSKPGEKSPERSQQESVMIRCSSSDHESPNKEFNQLSMNENNLEISLNTGINRRHESSEKSGDQQHAVSEKSTKEGTKNPEIMDSSKIRKEETALTKVIDNVTENPTNSPGGTNALQFSFELKAELSTPRDSEGAVSSDIFSDKCKKNSPSQIEEKDVFSSENLEKSVEEPFRETISTAMSHSAEISGGIFPISSLTPDTSVSGSFQEKLALEETSTESKIHAIRSHSESTEEGETELSDRENLGTAEECRKFDSRPLQNT